MGRSGWPRGARCRSGDGGGAELGAAVVRLRAIGYEVVLGTTTKALPFLPSGSPALAAQIHCFTRQGGRGGRLRSRASAPESRLDGIGSSSRSSDSGRLDGSIIAAATVFELLEESSERVIFIALRGVMEQHSTELL